MKFRVAVANAANRMGIEIINYLKSVNFPYNEVIALGKSSEVGQKLSFGEDEDLIVKSIVTHEFREGDINFFPYFENKLTKEYKDKAIKSKGIVIDLSNDSAFDKLIPSLIPIVNDHDFLLNNENAKIVSLPTAISTQLAIILKPLDMEYDIKRVVVSTYQSVSNSGEKRAMDELYNQTKGIYLNQDSQSQFFPSRISFNVIPGIGDMKDNVFQEEKRIEADLKKLIKKDLNILINIAYVPVFIGNSMYISVEFNREFELNDLQNILQETQELNIINEDKEQFTTPVDVVGEETILLSRIRKDHSTKSAISMWSCCDNLRRGIGVTAVEVAQFLIENVKLKGTK